MQCGVSGRRRGAFQAAADKMLAPDPATSSWSLRPPFEHLLFLLNSLSHLFRTE